MLKIIAICGNGSGSSLIMEMMVKEVVKDLGISAEVEHLSLNQYNSSVKCDVIVCGADLFDSIKNDANTKKIALRNVVDKKEISEKLKEIL